VEQSLCLVGQQDHEIHNLIHYRFAGPEYALDQIFSKARATAPCYLVFEDLDSIVSESVRSFFLNQVDGLSNNNGILMIGSTNHLELLDPGISKRPSRFDRKYLFPNPSFEERIMYAEFWRNKLLRDEKSGQNPNSGGTVSDPDEKLEFPKEMCRAVAGITDKFSFAYIQEAFVAALLMIASEQDEIFEFDVALQGNGCARHDKKNDGHDLDRLPLWRELKRQVKILREDLNSSGEIMAGMV